MTDKAWAGKLAGDDQFITAGASDNRFAWDPNDIQWQEDQPPAGGYAETLARQIAGG